MNNIPIEIISGCMCSGKSSLLALRAIQAQQKGLVFEAFKPSKDTRYKSKNILSRNGKIIPATVIKNYQDCRNYFLNSKVCDVLLFDEVSLIDERWLYDAIKDAQNMGYQIHVTSLNFLWRGNKPPMLNMLRNLYHTETPCYDAKSGISGKEGAIRTAKIKGDFDKDIEIEGEAEYMPVTLREFKEIRRKQKGLK